MGLRYAGMPLSSFRRDKLVPTPVALYATSTVELFPVGMRYVDEDDGRVFRYSRALDTLYSGYGAANGTVVANIINSVLPNAVVVGDTEMTVTIASDEGYAGNGLVAKDELQGGYIVFGHAVPASTQTRRIISNTAVASGGGTTSIVMDGPAGYVLAASGFAEVQLNPYRYLVQGDFPYNAFMCVPATYATTGLYFWGQTRGPCWVVPGGGDASPGNTTNDRMAYFVGDGTVNFGKALTIEEGYQIAGYCIDSTSAAASAMPLIMLTLD